MQVIKAGSAERLGVEAADLVEKYVRSSLSPVLGLATGGSVLPIYRELIRRHQEEGLSFASAQGFLLDEYLGLDTDHPQLYRNVIQTRFTGRVGFDPAGVHSPNARPDDLDEECHRYDLLVTNARIGLQILGVGRNGHLAFNEPGSPFDSRTRVVSLAPETRADNARFFPRPDQVPTRAITQGLATIMQAKHLLVVASGASKAPAVRDCLQGPIGECCPVTILRTHPRVTMILDPDAAGAL
ncbi:MAG: glucosamine-6-phosphate deaminase [Acidimicrobiia bacterium]|nr:glucosamine-6-phosphate deaminase [Acidimicrobiia bacterium]